MFKVIAFDNVLDNVQYYNKIAVISGREVEIRQTEYFVRKGLKRPNSGRSTSASKEEKILNRDKCLSRARKNVRRLANSNPDCNKFLTLTFGKNVTDLNEAHKYFKNFIVKMNRRYSDFKYLAVPEFQKRGAVHYHLLCNLPYVNVKNLKNIWGQGFIKLNKIDEIDNVGAYIVKYMTKENIDERLTERRCFYHSRNLTKPEIITDSAQIAALERELGNLEVKRVYIYEFDNEYLGHTSVTSLLLKEDIDLSRVKRLMPIPNKIFDRFLKDGLHASLLRSC